MFKYRPALTLVALSALAGCAGMTLPIPGTTSSGPSTSGGAPAEAPAPRQIEVAKVELEPTIAIDMDETGREGPDDEAVGTVSVRPAGETAPVPSDEDAADDPAIWINPVDPDASLVLGTDKQSGLYVYTLTGTLVDALLVGPLNNVDLREGIAPGATYVVASNDARHAVSVFLILPDQDFNPVVSLLDEFPTAKEEPYGICLGRTATGLMPVVTYKDGTVQIFEFPALSDPAGAVVAANPTPDQRVQATLVRRVQLGSQLEGCVVDEVHNRVFIGEEGYGIWVLDLSDPQSEPKVLDTIVSDNGLAMDVEGLTLWRGKHGQGWLIASAQGRDRFVVYNREYPFSPVGVFSIGDLLDTEGNVIIDRVTHTDGIDVRSGAVGSRFSRGLLVVQDDVNTAPDDTQNFKYVDWRVVEAELGLAQLTPEE